MSASRTVLSIAALWLAFAAIAALYLWPQVPRTVAGWALFIVFAPPLYVLAEAAGEWLISTSPARAVFGHRSRFVRIIGGVLFGVLFLCLVLWAQSWAS